MCVCVCVCVCVCARARARACVCVYVRAPQSDVLFALLASAPKMYACVLSRLLVPDEDRCSRVFKRSSIFRAQRDHGITSAV